jgi:hypothetical protein
LRRWRIYSICVPTTVIPAVVSAVIAAVVKLVDLDYVRIPSAIGQKRSGQKT